MVWWFGKPRIEKYEEEFKPDEMKKRRTFYDISFRVDDPEKVRGFLSRVFEDYDFKIVVNKLTKFEELEEDLFLGGKLKPVRAVIKGRKTIDLGLKYPGRIILSTIFGIIFLLYFIYSNTMIYFYFGIILMAIALIYLLIRKKVELDVWAKLVGVYDPATNSADLRLIMAGDIKKYDKRAEDELETTMNDIFIVVSEKFQEKPKGEIVEVIKEGKKPWEKEETKKDEIVKMISLIRKDIQSLDSRFARGEISEEAYKEARKNLEERLEKYETLLEFFS